MNTAIAAIPVFESVPFHDREILAARIDGEVRVPMKRFCGTIGLPWESQRQRIERTDMLKRGASVMQVPSDGGVQEQTALPVRLLAPFLMGVSTRRLEPDVAARVVLFQEQCADVLYRFFFARPAALTAIAARPQSPPWQELDAARSAFPKLIDALSAEGRPDVRRAYYQLLQRTADRLELDVPALDRIGANAPSADGLVERLVAGLRLLTDRRATWNHFGKRGCNGRLAIVLPEIQRLFERYDIDIAIDDALRAAFAAGNRHYRITTAFMDSGIARHRVFATILAPWPIARDAA